MFDNKPNTTHETWIYDCEEKHRPPKMSVLGVEVMGNCAFLTIAKYEETYEVSKYTRIEGICVDLNTLLNALGVMGFRIENG